MLRSLTSLAFLAGLFVTWVCHWTPAAHGQDNEAKKEALLKAMRKAEEDYRIFFKKPETPAEYWAAIDFEFKVGKYDVAALLLDELVKLQPKEKTDQVLLDIEDAQGMSTFLRLGTVPRWYENDELNEEAKQNVNELIDRVTKALEKKLSDPVRITKLIDQLFAPTREERAWAFRQLKRTKYRAAPYLVDRLKLNINTAEHERLKQIILKLDPDVMLPMREILKPASAADYQDTDLRYTILELFRLRNDRSIVPYLWHMSSSPKYPAMIQSKAKSMLSTLLEIPEDKLPDPRAALTKLAERYYHHQEHFPHSLYDGKSEQSFIRFWPWKPGRQLARGQEVVKKPVSEAEFDFALRHAQEALDLDPNYRPAQKLVLTLVLDKTYRRNLDKFLLEPLPPKLHNLLATVDADLLIEVLDNAIRQRNLAVILPAVRALGERGEFKAAAPSISGPARGLVKALFYPDRRVQMAAVQALLQIPSGQNSVVKTQILHLLERFLSSDTESKALLVHVPEALAMKMRENFKAINLFPELVRTRAEAFKTLHQSAAFDVIFIDRSFPEKELPFFLSQLRADTDAGALPVFLLADMKTRDSLAALAKRHRNVHVLLDGLTFMPKVLQKEISEKYNFSKAPDFVFGVPYVNRARVEEAAATRPGVALSNKERGFLRTESMEVLVKMASGEIEGFSLRPVKPALLANAKSKDLGEKALAALASVPGPDVQQRLAWIALDKTQEMKLRRAAAVQLHRHIVKNSLLLNKIEIGDLRQSYQNEADAEMRKHLAILISHLRSTSSQTGNKLENFQPAPIK